MKHTDEVWALVRDQRGVLWVVPRRWVRDEVVIAEGAKTDMFVQRARQHASSARCAE